MNTEMLGIAGGGSASLNQDVLNKLKAADRKASVAPVERKLETWKKESEKMAEIKALNLELISSFKAMSLDNTTNAFEQKTATTSGTAVNYDVDDVAALINGTTNIEVTQLARKDVYQTDTFTDQYSQIKNADDEGDKITITIKDNDGNNVDYEFSTQSKTYQGLAMDINANSNFVASIEQVSDTDFRLVIKSANTGTKNELTIKQTDMTLFGTGDKTVSNNTADGYRTLEAKNLHAVVDGTSYDVSANSITIQGSLKATANEIGTSSITVRQDTSGILAGVKDMAEKYNAMITLIDTELNSVDSPIKDKTSLREIKSNIKDIFFDKYGSNNEFNIFSMVKETGSGASATVKGAFAFDKYGKLSIDETVLNKVISTDLDSLKALFIGTAENKGLGTKLYAYADSLDGYQGLLSNYDENMLKRKVGDPGLNNGLDGELEKAIKTLDNKYDLMAESFASYGSLIASMEAQFGSLKMMMQQKTNN